MCVQDAGARGCRYILGWARIGIEIGMRCMSQRSLIDRFLLGCGRIGFAFAPHCTALSLLYIRSLLGVYTVHVA